MKRNSAKFKNLILWTILVVLLLFIAKNPLNVQDGYENPPRAKVGQIDLSKWDFKEYGNLNLDGEWEFYDGRFIGVRKLSENEEKSYSQVPGNWQLYSDNPRGYATYKIVASGLEDRAHAIIVGRVFSSYKLWINGNLEASVGSLSKDDKDIFGKIMSKMIFIDPEDGKIELVFQVSGNDYYKSGIIDSVKLGYYDDIMRVYRFEMIRDAMIAGMMIIMSVYHIMRHMFRRKNKKNLYFGILAFLVFFQTSFEGHMMFSKIFLNLDFRYEDVIQRTVLFFVLPSLASYLNCFFDESMDRKFLKSIWGISALFSIMIFATDSSKVGPLVQAYNVLAIFYMAYMLVFLVKRATQKDIYSIMMVGGFLFLTYTVINDIGVDMGGWRNEYMLTYGLLAFLMVHMVAISMKYAESFNSAERIKEELIEKNRELIMSNSEKVKTVNERTKQIAETENLYRQLFEAPFEGIAIILDGVMLKVNSKLCEMSGYEEKELVGKSVMAFMDEKSRKGIIDRRGSTKDEYYEIKMIRRDSTEIDMEVFARNIEYKGKTARIAAVRDITLRNRIAKINRDNLKFLQVMMDTIPNPVFYKNLDGVYLGVNESYAKFHGMAKEDIIGKSTHDILTETLCSICCLKEALVIESGQKTVYELELKDSSNSKRDMICNIDSFTDEEGEIAGIVGVMADITMLKEIEDQLKKASITDHLTKLYNRVKFTEVLDQRFDAGDFEISVIMFDIDHFKRINDTYGHLVGDDVLIEISNMVQDMVGQRGIVARWGGEEFIILLFEGHAEESVEVAESIRTAVETNDFDKVGKITCSFGIASLRDGDTKNTFITRADDALYEAKNTGRNKVVAF